MSVMSVADTEGSCDLAPGGALLPVVGADARVPLVTGGTCRYVNLDYAASAPALESVAERVDQVLQLYSSVHRGAGYASRVCTTVYESARQDVLEFIGARGDDVAVFTRNTTDALGLLASAVPGEAIVLDIEHHANLLPWQRRGDRVLAGQPTLAATLAAVEAELRRRPAALLTVTGASNVTGECTPLGEFAALARRHGARLAVDGAQLVPHRRVDLARLGVDYLAFSGHKVYAPFGAGVLAGRRDWLDAAPPYLAGGGAVREVTVSRTRWAAAPARHEAGTPNIVGVAALAAACQALSGLGDGQLAAHEHALSQQLFTGLAALGLSPHRIWPDTATSISGYAPGQADVVGIVSFSVPGVPGGKVAAYLSAEHGIGVRDGRFCAHPLLRRLDISQAIRVSVGAGTRSADITRLLGALARLQQAGPAWDYRNSDAGWSPLPETRQLPDWLGTGSLAGQARLCDPAQPGA
jgi:selenocysteine lyase/cysteine desulfurase